MGWTIPHSITRRELVRELAEGWENESSKLTTLAHCCRGNTQYILRETTYRDGITPPQRWIQVNLLQRYGETWGYKDMDETMGPTVATCPPAYLDRCTEPGNEWAKTWRERCRSYWSARNKPLKVGQYLQFHAGCRPAGVTVTKLRPLTGTDRLGLPYRIPRRLLAGATVLDQPPPDKTPSLPSFQGASDIYRLRHFIGTGQKQTLRACLNGEEATHFQEILKTYADRVEAMPKTGETDGQGDEAIVYLHYFTAGADWWITEKDMGNEDDEVKGMQHQAFGLARIHEIELGYISIQEALECGAELDLYFTPRTLREVRAKLEQRA